MKTIQFDEFGPPLSVLHLVDIEKPQPNADEILVKVLFRPINPSDLYYINGNYGIIPELPTVPGFECMGIIDSLGRNVSKYKVGDRVIPMGIRGTWQEYIIAKPNQLILIPEKLLNESAAQLFVNPITAWILINEKLQLKKDEWLIQTAAGSTLGRMVIQLSKLIGFKTINLVRRDAQIKELLELGADVVYNIDEDNILSKIQKITNGGVNGGIDAVGGKMCEIALKSLKAKSKLIVYGLLSMQKTPIDTGEMIFKETSIEGFWLSSWFKYSNPIKSQTIISELMNQMIRGNITPPVEAIYELKDFKTAIKNSQKTGRSGKILLKS